jgi:hypothetical protein
LVHESFLWPIAAVRDDVVISSHSAVWVVGVGLLAVGGVMAGGRPVWELRRGSRDAVVPMRSGRRGVGEIAKIESKIRISRAPHRGVSTGR